MSKSEKTCIAIFFWKTLLMHLLKWQYQPAYQGRSWKFTIIEQRKRIESHLQENPGLKGQLTELVDKAYRYAVIGAVRETGLSINGFPQRGYIIMGNIFLTSADTFIATSSESIFGAVDSAGKETVRILDSPAPIGLKIDTAVDTVSFQGNSADFTYRLAGNMLTISQAGVTIVTLTLGDHPLSVSMANGTADIVMTGLGRATFGGTVIPLC